MTPEPTDDSTETKPTGNPVNVSTSTEKGSYSDYDEQCRLAKSWALIASTKQTSNSGRSKMRTSYSGKRTIVSAFAFALLVSVGQFVLTFAFPESPEASEAEGLIRVVIMLIFFVSPMLLCGIALWRTKEQICWRTREERRRFRLLGRVGLVLPYPTVLVTGLYEFNRWWQFDLSF